jgi:Derlin-2/3
MVLFNIVAPYTGIMFLSNSLNFMMTYYWGRKSKMQFVNLMGVFIIRAPYLPWFYLVFSYLLESDFKIDFLGMLIGHLFFYFKDIFPRLKRSGGVQVLATPNFV